MKKRLLVVFALLTLGPGLLEAQEAARQRAREALSPELFREVEGLVNSARAEGLPTEPLFNKALEGLAKGVPEGRLLPALNAYSARLREANRAFGIFANGPLTVAGADALQRGVGVETLRSLSQGEEGSPGPSPMAVLVLAELVEAGVPADRALGVLREALRNRTREQRMLEISGEVRRLMRRGQSPQEAADHVRRALQRGRGGGGVGPPVPPGSEPMTQGRRRAGRGRGGG